MSFKCTPSGSSGRNLWGNIKKLQLRLQLPPHIHSTLAQIENNANKEISKDLKKPSKNQEKNEERKNTSKEWWNVYYPLAAIKILIQSLDITAFFLSSK